MKRVFGLVEVVFDGIYLLSALAIGAALIISHPQDATALTAGLMALILAGGDAFHLIPRMASALCRDEERFRAALGRGKLTTSVTMTVFYIILWRLGLALFPAPSPGWTELVYILAAIRILLCLLPQNRWLERYPPVRWGVIRNIPFFILGLICAGLYYINRGAVPALAGMWLAVVISFACYLPVVLFSNSNPKFGMLMLPKTCAYLWMLAMFTSMYF